MACLSNDFRIAGIPVAEAGEDNGVDEFFERAFAWSIDGTPIVPIPFICGSGPLVS